MMAGIINARFSVFEKLRSIKRLMLSKAKRDLILQKICSTAENSSQLNALEVKKSCIST